MDTNIELPNNYDSAYEFYRHEVLGDYAEPITKKFEQELFTKFQTARGISRKKIREKLINANLRLVFKIAKEYQHCGMEFEDVISEGNIGLVKAVDKFDFSRGVRLSSYAQYWIRQCITRSLTNKGKMVRLPVALNDVFLKMLKYVKKHEEIHSKKPTSAEIAQKLKVKKSKIDLIMEATGGVCSLDLPIGEDGPSVLGDIIPDERNLNPSQRASASDDAKTLASYMNMLPKKERDILERRFGIGGKDRQTLEKIGERYNLTRERIRQIEWIAMRKLRNLIGSKIPLD